MGVLGHFNDSVTIVNRTDRPLNVRYDGEDITLPPGEIPNFPKVAVPYAINQNPLMGSKHPVDPRKFISKIGIVGSKKYPCDPIPTDVLRRAESKLEVVDRDGDTWGEPMEKRQVLRRAKTYSSYEAAVSLPDEFEVNRNID